MLVFLLVTIYLAVLTVGFRLRSGDYLRARFMVRLFLVTLPLGVVLYLVTRPDLGFLPRRWLETNEVMEVAFFVFVYSAVFFGGILQVYNLADRGFSLRIMIDIESSPAGAMTTDQVVESYSAGRGIGWMYQKRMDDLVRLNLVKITGDTVVATPAGRRIAARFAWLRRYLRVVP